MVYFPPYIIKSIPDTFELDNFNHTIVKIPAIDKSSYELIAKIMTEIGGESSFVPSKVSKDKLDCFLNGNQIRLELLVKKIGDSKICESCKDIYNAYRKYKKNKFTIKCSSDHTLFLGEKTLIMGIINVTPDSFSDGGESFNIDTAIKNALRMQESGADILDIGGESSRPGARQISAEEELERILPIIKELKTAVRIPISVDTYKAKVADKAIEAGAVIVNDISAMQMDTDMPKVIAENNVPVVLMHMKGTPQNMQANPEYDCVIDEILYSLNERIFFALEKGISPDKILIDPGIGFGKTLDHNLEIINSLDSFKSLGYPILIGTSRKSVIGNVLKLPPKERIEGTAATIAISIMNGAHIVRVHDILQMKRVAVMVDAIKKSYA